MLKVIGYFCIAWAFFNFSTALIHGDDEAIIRHLTYVGRTVYGRVRQGGALLICLIAWSMIGDKFALARAELPIEEKRPPLSPYVEIKYLSCEIELALSAFNVSGFLSAKVCYLGLQSFCWFATAEDCLSDRFPMIVIKSSTIYRIWMDQICMDGLNECRSSTEVLNLKFDNQSIGFNLRLFKSGQAIRDMVDNYIRKQVGTFDYWQSVGGFFSGDSSLFGCIGGFICDSNLFFAREIQSNGGNPQATRSQGENKGEERNGVTRRFLPKGFALFCLGGAFLGGVVTFLFLSLGRRV